MMKQKAQSIVEFALVLPLFLMFVFGIFSVSGIFADYLYLSTVARNSAREASVVDMSGDYQSHYQKIIKSYNGMDLPVNIYDWDSQKKEYFDITYDQDSQNVLVTINAKMNSKGSLFASVVDRIAGEKTLHKFDMNITYTMYSEKNKSQE
ncbi:TadE family protein [Mitsuokella multacida]|uniref:TadE family protein n=1 Tax=Mitsuokella multacida TaxID=52226 RepID=UPI00241E2C25|nr:TadE family protein [Mitsuokella multacida]